jgi:hypothetical protein
LYGEIYLLGFMALGFLLGMTHALEADHLAAVGSLAVGAKPTKRGIALSGFAWGLGHTITLFLICTGAILLGLTLTEHVTAVLEFCVGIVLVLLGGDIFRRLYLKKIHFHIHTHETGMKHLHAYSHDQNNHDINKHSHTRAPFLRALVIGLLHGAAGSSGLLALAIATTKDPIISLGYVFVFGAGSILGMASLSLVVAWPLKAAEKHAVLLYQGFPYGAGLFAICLGLNVILASAPSAFAYSF